MKLLVPEILQQASDIKNEKERIEFLKRHSDNKLLMYLLALNFDPTVEFDLPAGEPPFKRTPLPVGMSEANLYSENRRLYLFIKDHPRRPKNVTRLRTENLFIQMLEGVNAIEADLLVSLKDKQLHRRYRGVTAAVVRQAFPGVLPDVVKTPAENA
jgi:hypothetical protein